MQPFTIPVRVYWEDTDAGGIVYYANYLRFLERARTDWLSSLGIDQAALLRDERLQFAVVEAHVHYHRPARYGDQLQVSVLLVACRGASVEMRQEVRRGTPAGELLDSGDLTSPRVRASVLRGRDLPIGIGDMDTSLYLLFKAIRAQSTVALSGESADEVFGGYRWFHDPAAVHDGTFPWLAGAGGLRFTALEEVLDQDVLNKLDLPGYRARCYRQALDEVPRLPGETGLEARMREISHLHLTRFVQILLDRKDRMSMANGLEVRVPFCDHRLVQYVFNAPWAMKTFDGREKSLLRAAARDVLPDSILERRKSPYPSTQDPGYEKALRDEASALLDRGTLAAAPLVDPAKVRALLNRPQNPAVQDEVRPALEGFLQFNAWLETTAVRITL
jgi:asparagine synthase (glutamine-hydrolysing)